MAFYNPQRVVFNPDTGVIQNAGKVGGVLYDVMRQNYHDKLKEQHLNEERALKKEQLEFNQAMQNNALLQNERNFSFQQERARIADAQWQKNFDQRATELRANNALRDLNYQKGLLELQKIQNEINAKQKEAQFLDNLDSQAFDRIENKADAQFLDLAEETGETYNTSHGFIRGAGERLFGGLGSKSTDLNRASDLFLNRVFTDLLKGGKNAKWNLENLKSNFPLNDSLLEANNQRVAQALTGEWLNHAPFAYKAELVEKLDNAKSSRAREAALEEYAQNMAFYKEYAPKARAFYWDEEIPGEKIPLSQLVTPQQQPLTQDVLEKQNMISFK